MRTYPNQPEIDKMRNIIQEELEKSLPYCHLNEWFIKSVHFANMLDTIMDRVRENV